MGRTRTASAPALTPMELARWAWRQLTSMRTALILLFLLALAAVPGSIIPQQAISPSDVFAFRQANPDLSRWYDRLGLFHVYTSAWFGAVYVLLMLSLVGCIVPRLRHYWRGFRAEPPTAPRHLARLPAHHEWESDAPVEEVRGAAVRVLRSARFRLREYDDEAGRRVVAAERGRLREGGNLVFHLSVLVVLTGVAIGSLFGFTGGAYLVEGQGFSNSLTQYDEFKPGALFDTADLAPFTLTLEDFEASYQTQGDQRGAPRSFDAEVSYQAAPGAPTQQAGLQVNEPLEIDDTSIFLVGNGYAPEITVRDGSGRVVFSGPVPFLPQDSSMTSFGVVKVPDAQPTSLGFEGYFLPTAAITPERGPHSIFPEALDPAVVLTGYRGDLGMDDGRPQSVFVLDKEELTQLEADGEPFRLLLRPGQSRQLPGGLGSISFDGVSRATQLQISHTPGKGIALGGVLLGLAGLVTSLYIRPRRAWVRISGADGRTVVEAAGLDRVSGGDLDTALGRWVQQIRARTDEPAGQKELSS
ncbi:MAG TPA: cytochrome c biogenesis protein ResB [Nocardioidaceae bacterium]|nr:cytochrome c biogenesis protein ResB [Nocardioidaceae bacterium]